MQYLEKLKTDLKRAKAECRTATWWAIAMMALCLVFVCTTAYHKSGKDEMEVKLINCVQGKPLASEMPSFKCPNSIRILDIETGAIVCYCDTENTQTLLPIPKTCPGPHRELSECLTGCSDETLFYRCKPESTQVPSTSP